MLMLLVHCLVIKKERREKETLGTNESRAGDASTNDDNVDVGSVSRSTFSVSGCRCHDDAVHLLDSHLSGDLFLHNDEAINRNDKRENRDDDCSQCVLIQSHRNGCMFEPKQMPNLMHSHRLEIDHHERRG